MKNSAVKVYHPSLFFRAEETVVSRLMTLELHGGIGLTSGNIYKTRADGESR